ncbi:MAG: cytochrome ubiquinol oxidase subunit I [Fervidicoccaceae archaeon]
MTPGFIEFLLLGIAVIVHIGFVTTTLGVGIIVAVYRYLSYARKDQNLEAFARRAFRLLVVTELFSGVWGTVITVFLAGFFPSLTAIAASALFGPLAISIASIMIRVPSIAIFWYTWGKVSPKLHSIIGFIMGLSGFGIPFGFRTIFAEITSPRSVAALLQGTQPSLLYAYTDPVFWGLYAHTVIAAVSVGAFMVAAIMIMDRDVLWSRKALLFATIFLLLQPIAGTAYYLILSNNAQYIANSITSGEFMPVLAVKLFLFAVLLAASIHLMRRLGANTIPSYGKYIGILAIAVAITGEFMNDGSRYPYMVVLGSSGISIESLANPLMNIQSVFPAILTISVFLALSIAVFSIAIYYAMIKRFVL